MTPSRAYLALFFAFSICSVSPVEVRYIMPEITKAMIAMVVKIPKSQERTLERMAAIPPEGSAKPGTTGKQTPPILVKFELSRNFPLNN